MNNGAWIILTDKWHLGALRLLNFTCIAILFGAVQDDVAKWTHTGGPFVLLGQSSLEVFCAHLLVCFAALAWVGDGTGLAVWPQVAIVTVGLLVLLGVAKLFAKQNAR
jgi:hypothetical protein